MTTLDLPEFLRFMVDRCYAKSIRTPEYLLRTKDGVHDGYGQHLVVAQMFGFDDNFEFEVEFRPGAAPLTFKRTKWNPAKQFALGGESPDLTLPLDDDMIHWKQTNMYGQMVFHPEDPGVAEFFRERGTPLPKDYRYRVLVLRYERDADA